MDEKSVRKSHGHHIPPAKGMGERALLLLGLLSLLTAADEVCHADAQHRATSNPSEGHAVETGQRKARALLVFNGNGHDRTICSTGSDLFDVFANGQRRQFAIFIIGRRNRNLEGRDSVVARRSGRLGNLIRTLNEARD